MQVMTSSLLQIQPLIKHLRIKCHDSCKWEISAVLNTTCEFPDDHHKATSPSKWLVKSLNVVLPKQLGQLDYPVMTVGVQLQSPSTKQKSSLKGVNGESERNHHHTSNLSEYAKCFRKIYEQKLRTRWMYIHLYPSPTIETLVKFEERKLCYFFQSSWWGPSKIWTPDSSSCLHFRNLT